MGIVKKKKVAKQEKEGGSESILTPNLIFERLDFARFLEQSDTIVQSIFAISAIHSDSYI